MNTAISTACLYPLETEAALNLLLRQGFRRLELFINAESEMEDDFIGLLQGRLKEYGAHVFSLHLHTSAFEPMMFFSSYPRRFYDSLQQYTGYFATAARLGAGVVVFHGDLSQGSLPEEQCFERFRLLAEAARREGVVLAQENVSRCRSRSAAFMRRMRKALGPGAVKFVFDVKQALRAGESPADIIAAMGSDIVNVHVSDSLGSRDCLLPGRGEFDFPALLSVLRMQGYDGPLTIEVYRHSFGAPGELWQSALALEDVLRDST